MQSLDQSANGRDISVAVGDTIELHLDERSTAGYRWQFVHDGAPACIVSNDRFEPPADPVPGRPGTHTWTFRAEHPGHTTIELAARRSWEAGAPPASTFRITVTVTR